MKPMELTPYKANAKVHPQAQIDHIANSIKEFGWQQPIVVDNDNVVIIGHGRLLAAKQLMLDKVPVVRATDLTEDQVKALRLADNKTNESEWDFDLLDEELAALDITGFDMSDFGFEVGEDFVDHNYDVQEDEVPEVQEEAVSKLGQIYQLGEHRLMCGDSTDAETVKILMGGAVADVVFTDPPYGMGKEADGVLNDNLNYTKLLEFNKQWIPISFDNLKDTGCWYCWGIDEPLMDIYSHILKPLKEKNKLVIRNYITWAKHSAFGINSAEMLSYPRETEKCWFVMKGQDWNNNNAEFFNTKFQRILNYMQEEAEKAGLKPADIQNACGVQMYSHWFTRSQFSVISEKHYKELQAYFPGCFLKPYADLRKMLGDSNNPTECLKPYFDAVAHDDFGDIGLTDVWRISTTSSKERELTGGHATPKPIALCSRAIQSSTRHGENVLDMFGGSGSTLIACEQTGRKCYMMELDPHYVDVIIRRWENLTGKKAVLLNERG